MALAVTINSYPAGIERGMNVTHFYGVIVASGSYATGGDAFAIPLGTVSSANPLSYAFADVYGISGVIYALDLVTAKLKVFEQTTVAGPLVELAAGVYPAAVTGDSIAFHVVVTNT